MSPRQSALDLGSDAEDDEGDEQRAEDAQRDLQRVAGRRRVPLAEEHARLSAALRALGDVSGRTPPAAPPTPAPGLRPRAPKSTPATARKRAPRGANRVAVLQAVEKRPGATSAEIATVSGVQGSTLHTLLARLVKSGELQTEALPTGRTGYALSQTQPEASADSAAGASDTA